MTFRQMELFMLVCEHQSINRAAEASFVSQQGVSRMIKELEEELGCTLLTRSKQGVALTKSGTYFLGECRTMVEKKNFLQENLSQMEDLPIEIIHVGMAFGVISALPFGLISSFERDHPYAKIDYNDRADYYLEHQLVKGDYDFCVTTGIVDSDVLAGELLAVEGNYLCIPSTHILHSQETITMDDLQNQPFAMFSTQFHIRHNFELVCKKAGFTPNIVIASNDFNSLKEIAIHNNLLFVIPAHTTPSQNDGVRYYPFPDDSFQWEIHFVKKKNKVLTDAMEDCYRHIKHYALMNTDVPSADS